jgi:hypothetical protein
MRRTFAVLALLFIGAPLLAEDQRQVKRDLVRELMKVLDGRSLTQSMIDILLARDAEPSAPPELLSQLNEEERKQYDESVKLQSEQRARFRDRLFASIDYATYTEEVYAPAFDSTFSAAEVRELIAFFKSSAGQKTVKIFPELARSMVRNTDKLRSIADLIEQGPPLEPWQQAMADLRAVATAAEAYATDADKYPDVRSYEDLEAVLTPTYIRTMPEKDPWGTAFQYVVSADLTHYRFISAGADRRFDWNSQRIVESAAHEAKSLDDDIIFQDGVFVQYPPGANQASQ